MSTTALEQTAPMVAGGDRTEARPAEERGRTHIEPRVVERIVAAVADENDAVVGGPRRLLGMRMGQREGVRVEASIKESRADVSVTAMLIYPSRVREVADELRRTATTRVRELTGIRVTTFDVTVAGLVHDVPTKVR